MIFKNEELKINQEDCIKFYNKHANETIEYSAYFAFVLTSVLVMGSEKLGENGLGYPMVTLVISWVLGLFFGWPAFVNLFLQDVSKKVKYLVTKKKIEKNIVIRSSLGRLLDPSNCLYLLMSIGCFQTGYFIVGGLMVAYVIGDVYSQNQYQALVYQMVENSVKDDIVKVMNESSEKK